jgi:hypothetical protein
MQPASPSSTPRRRSIALTLPLLAALVIGCASEDPKWNGPPPAGGPAPAPPGQGASCTYPKVNYGSAVGDIVDPTLTWGGYPAGAGQPGEIAIRDYFDCAGKKGINAILALEVSVLCEPCREEAKLMRDLLDGPWKEMGVQVVSLIVLDQNGAPATPDVALAWRDEFGLDASAVVADPELSFPPHQSGVVYPGRAVIDPRTMKIVEVAYGYSGELDVIEHLAEKNAGH